MKMQASEKVLEKPILIYIYITLMSLLLESKFNHLNFDQPAKKTI